MEVYSIEKEELHKLDNRSVEYEDELQSNLLKADGAEVGGVRFLYISQEGTPDAEGGFFDILGIDEGGDTIIVELKRGRTPRHVVSQALEYASGIRKEDYEKLNQRFQDFVRTRRDTVDQDLREAHADYFELEGELLEPDEFNNNFHLVILAAEFDDITLNMADLLRDHELDVVCVRYETFTDEDSELRLLTTEGIRRPLELEPGGGPSPDERTELQREFWDGFFEKLDDHDNDLYYTNSTQPGNYLPVRGTLPNAADIALGTDLRRSEIQVKLHLRDDGSDMFDFLLENKAEIESEIGEELLWDPDSARYEYIRLVRKGNIRENREKWDEFHSWLLDNWIQLDEVFASYLRQMK